MQASLSQKGMRFPKANEIRSDIPIPKGKESPYGVLGKCKSFLEKLKPGQSFTFHDGTNTLYRVAKLYGMVIKRRKLPDGGWIYWKVK